MHEPIQLSDRNTRARTLLKNCRNGASQTRGVGKGLLQAIAVTIAALLVSQSYSVFGGSGGSVTPSSGSGYSYSSIAYNGLVVAKDAKNYINASLPSTSASYPSPSASTSASTRYAVGGYKVYASSSIPSGTTGDNPDLEAELANRNIVVTPAQCAATYDFASGEEFINVGGTLKRHLVVSGTASEGTAARFRGFGKDNTGIKRMLFEVLMKGPFDFGPNPTETEGVDPCRALKLPYEYSGNEEDLVIVVDAVALSANPLALTCPDAPVQLQCGDTLTYPTISTSGQCGNVTFSYDPPPGTVAGRAAALPIGTTLATVTAVDAAGNLNTCTVKIVVSDPSVPTFTNIPAPIVQPNDKGACGAVVTWTPPTASPSCAVADTVPAVTSTATPGSTFPVGTTTVTYTATDAAGKEATCSFTVTVVDTEKPTPPPTPLPTVNGDCVTGAVTLTAPEGPKDNCGIVSIAASPAGPYTASTLVTWTFEDAAGNASTALQQVVFSDSSLPTFLTYPASITKPNESGKCGAQVTWTEPTAIPSCSGSSVIVTRTSALASGSFFPVGTTEVTYQAEDNTGKTAPYSFTVTVVDNEAPKPPTLATVTVDCTGIPATLPTPTATDNCAPNGIAGVASPAAGPFTASTTVTWTFTDASGNSSTAIQNVVVNGYKFQGFYDPVNGRDGTCASPNLNSTITAGSSVPLKFDVLDCSGAIATGITPLVTISVEDGTCTPTEVTGGPATFVNGQWHFQWSTKKPQKGGKFLLTVKAVAGGPVIGSTIIVLK